MLLNAGLPAAVWQIFVKTTLFVPWGDYGFGR